MIALIISVVLAVLGVIHIAKKKSLKKIIFFFITAALVLVIGILNNTLCTETILLSTDTLDAITQIDWSNKDALNGIGLRGVAKNYYYDFSKETPQNYIVHISVNTDFSEDDAQKADGTYKNIHYKFTERPSVSTLESIWYRVCKKDFTVNRYYWVYLGETELYIIETALKGQPYLLEELIFELKRKYDALA